MARQVDKHNNMDPQRQILYACGSAVSGADNVYEIRGLLRLALQRMHSVQPAGESAAEDRAGQDRGEA